MPRPDKQLNDAIMIKPGLSFHALTEITGREDAYFTGIEQIAIFLKASVAGTLDVDMEMEGSWEEIKAGEATVIGMNIVRIEHALYKKGRLRLRWTPGAQPGTVSAWATGFPRGAQGPDFKQGIPGSIST